MEPSPPPAPAPAGRLSATSGQATVDYAALLTLVAVAFAGAGAATGLGGVPSRIAHVVRTGICIVGGDVCRPADAAAEGLAPCIVDERADGGGLIVSIVALRLGEAGEWTVARRSDGTVLVTRSEERRAGAGAGLGLEVGPLDIGVAGSLDGVLARGEAWELPSTEAAARLLAAARSGQRLAAPTWRFGDLGEEAAAWLGIDATGAPVAGVEASWRSAAGARVGRGETTIYIHAGTQLGASLDVLPLSVGGARRGTSAAPGGGRTGPLVLAFTRDAHGPRELAFRRVQSGERSGEVVETVGRLDLRDPVNRAIAERLLRVRLPWPPAVATDLRAVVLRTVRAGTVERSVYAVEDRSRRLVFVARLAVELGVEASSLAFSRRLVGATAWTHGSPERRRVDCVGDDR